MQGLNEVASALDVLARRGMLYGGTRLRPRLVVRVWSTTYIVIKYSDGGTQYIDKRRRLAVHIPTKMYKDAVEALNALASQGLLYADGRRVASVHRVGRRAVAVLEDGRTATRMKKLVVQLPP